MNNEIKLRQAAKALIRAADALNEGTSWPDSKRSPNQEHLKVVKAEIKAALALVKEANVS